MKQYSINNALPFFVQCLFQFGAQPCQRTIR
jgi:hypothetical protein